MDLVVPIVRTTAFAQRGRRPSRPPRPSHRRILYVGFCPAILYRKRMRWYEEFPQPQPRFRESKSKFAGLVAFDSGPTRSEKERARVLEISREKIQGSNPDNSKKDCDRCLETVGVEFKKSRKWPRDSVSLRQVVAVKNTVRKLEREVR